MDRRHCRQHRVHTARVGLVLGQEADTGVRRSLARVEPAWAPDSGALFYVSNRGGSMDLWRQPLDTRTLPSRDPEPMTAGVGMRSAALSRDGRRLAYSRGRQIQNVWRVPILSDRPATWLDAEQITFDQALAEYMDVSPDGTRVAVSSDRGRNQDLWIFPVSGGQPTQLTRDETGDWNTSYSTRGRFFGLKE